MKDGIYKSDNAYYFVKDEKVLMNLEGSTYKTTKNFMIGAEHMQLLTNEMDTEFDDNYSNAKNW